MKKSKRNAAGDDNRKIIRRSLRSHDHGVVADRGSAQFDELPRVAAIHDSELDLAGVDLLVSGCPASGRRVCGMGYRSVCRYSQSDNFGAACFDFCGRGRTRQHDRAQGAVLSIVGAKHLCSGNQHIDHGFPVLDQPSGFRLRIYSFGLAIGNRGCMHVAARSIYIEQGAGPTGFKGRLMAVSRGYEIDKYVLEQRFMLVLMLIVLLSFLLFVRIAYLQIVQHDRFEQMSRKNHVDSVPLAPVRGLIVDRNNQILAHNVRVFNLEVLPDKVPDLEKSLRELSHLVELTPEDLEALKKMLESRPSFERQTLMANLTDEQATVFAVNQHRFPGIELKVGLQRDYPFGALTAHIVGYVGRISHDDRKLVNQGGEYDGISHIGKIGLESEYEKILKGSPGHSQVEMNAHGQIVRQIKQDLPSSGQTLHLSLDLMLQKESMDALEGHEGAVVAIEPKTGQVLALASAPTYDPNLFVNGISQAQYSELNTSKLKPLFNRSIYGQYAPGSTIKAFISLVGLEHGFSHERTVLCPGWFSVPNNERRYRCWARSGHGLVDGHSSIEQSCDVYFYDLAFRLGIERLQKGLARFGFGKKTGIDLPSERSGLLPNKQWKQKAHHQPWFPGDTVNSGVGQGYMLMTPVQLASITAVLANRGMAVTPRLLQMTENPVTRQQESTPLAAQENIDLQQVEFYDQVIESMRRVVHGVRGTASSLKTGIRYEMAGKTGTAQVVGIKPDETYDEENTPKELRDHSLFIGFAPLDDPQIAIAVVVEHGGSGGKVAAPIARRLIDYYLLERLKIDVPDHDARPVQET